MKKIEPASGETISVGTEADRYLHHLARLDLSLESKRELVRIIGTIMRSFVDRAFGDDATQLVRKDGDEIQVARETRFPAVVSSGHHNNPGERVLKAAFQKGVGRGRRKEKR
jgi:hypothetical protein